MDTVCCDKSGQLEVSGRMYSGVSLRYGCDDGLICLLYNSLVNVAAVSGNKVFTILMEECIDMSIFLNN